MAFEGSKVEIMSHCLSVNSVSVAVAILHPLVVCANHPSNLHFTPASGFLDSFYALMESSNKRATLGKMAAGILVTDLNGNRISFGRATARYFSKLINAFTLGFGYLTIVFTEKKQGIHDMIAGTLVVKK